MNQYVQDIINFLRAWNWPLILAFVCSGPFLSALAQVIKKNRQLEKWGVIQLLVGSLSCLHTTILLWLTNPALLNMFAIYSPAMYGYTQVWYPVIKKIDSKLSVLLTALNAVKPQNQLQTAADTTTVTASSDIPSTTSQVPAEADI